MEDFLRRLPFRSAQTLGFWRRRRQLDQLIIGVAFQLTDDDVVAIEAVAFGIL